MTPRSTACVAARPFHSLTDFWHRARVSRPVLERLVLAGGFDRSTASGRRGRPPGRVTRRDLLLQVAELDRYARSVDRAARGRGLAGATAAARPRPRTPRAAEAAARNSTDPLSREAAPAPERHALADGGVWARAAAQSQATPPPAGDSVQLTLDLGDEPDESESAGCPR